MAQTKAGKREFVQLAEVFDESKGMINIGHWWFSEKLDGMRCLWLPDTVGQVYSNLLFANLDKSKRGPHGVGNRIVSGLWSRYGKPIWAPNAWIKWQIAKGVLKEDRALDGELYIGRGKHQDLMSTVKTVHNASEARWEDVNFHVFDSPRFREVYSDGRIHNGTFKKDFQGVYDWMVQNNPLYRDLYRMDASRRETFEHLVAAGIVTPERLPLLQQLNWNPNVAREEAMALMSKIVDVPPGEVAGEGAIIRHGLSVWQPLRVHTMFKMKPWIDTEGVVTGYTEGEGRLVGTIGSVLIDWRGPDGRLVNLGLSGWTDQERNAIRDGTMCKRGEIVTFRYRELSDDGVPKEARYLRPFSEGE